jgi:hypothetical protein
MMEAMMKRLNFLVLALLMAPILPGSAFAQSVDVGAAIQTDARDPWVPPELRSVKPAPVTHGAALQAQVERKLRESFDAADVARAGALTREQAQAAGLGVVAKNFDRIDTAKSGKVTFEDLKKYLRARGAKL